MKTLRIHPATFLFLVLLLITGLGGLVIPYLVSITLHELAHAIVAKKLGYSLDKIWILPYGAGISFKEFSFSSEDEIKIAIAGPLMNFFLIILTISLWWLFPSTYIFTYSFAISNFSIAAFNLLPAFPLDGGRILNSILKTKLKVKTATKISTALNLMFSICFLILFIISFFFSLNFSFGLVAIFLFLGIIEGKFQGTYHPLLMEIPSAKKNIIQVKSFCVKSNVPLYKILPQINKNKFNVIYVKFPSGKIKIISEEMLKSFYKKGSPHSEIGSFIKSV